MFLVGFLDLTYVLNEEGLLHEVYIEKILKKLRLCWQTVSGLIPIWNDQAAFKRTRRSHCTGQAEKENYATNYAAAWLQSRRWWKKSKLFYKHCTRSLTVFTHKSLCVTVIIMLIFRLYSLVFSGSRLQVNVQLWCVKFSSKHSQQIRARELNQQRKRVSINWLDAYAP